MRLTLLVAIAVLVGACSSGPAAPEPTAAAPAMVDPPALPDFGPDVWILAEGTGSVKVGKDDPWLIVDIYTDFLCPACAQFDAEYGDQLNAAIAAGDLAVRYHHLTALDPSSASGNYSSRAATAALCMAKDGGFEPFGEDRPSFAAHYVGFRSALFAAQPQLGVGPDPTQQWLEALVVVAGGTEYAAYCVETNHASIEVSVGDYESARDLDARNVGQGAGPWVFVGDLPVDFTDPEWVPALTR